MTWQDDEDEPELDEREHPDPGDADWNMDPAEVACPCCKREISEDAQRCPHCGSYISEEDKPRRHAWWWIIAVVVVILLLVYVLR